MDVKAIYTSCACNRNPQALDWGYNNIICYAACNAVVLYDPQANGGTGAVTSTHVNHKQKINCVRWIRKRNNDPETAFLSSSDDKTVTLWCKKNSEFAPVAVLGGHTGTVATTDAFHLSVTDESSFLVASGSSDATIRLWDICIGSDPTCSQVIELKRNSALDVRLTLLPGTNIPMMAWGGTDALVHCYYRNSEGLFVECHTLHGHDDWVRGLDFKTCDDGSMYLASCSQDNLLRVWRISQRKSQEEDEDDEVDESSDEDVEGLSDEDVEEGGVLPDDEVRVQETSFTLEDIVVYSHQTRYIQVLCCGPRLTFYVTLETILSGHEDWAFSARWHPKPSKDEWGKGCHNLLSASMDATLIVWEPDQASGLWIEKVRLGGVGGNAMGFYGAAYSPDGTSILAHGFQGALHLWRLCEKDGSSSAWEPAVTPGGHFDSVVDLSWDPRGEYLLSCSKDKTTRLHAPWVAPAGMSWKEIARPQVHGYDMSCISSIGQLRFVSGADEKVLRAFEGTRNFVDNFKRISHVDILHHSDVKELAEGASVPSLGLSNKAVYETDLHDGAGDEQKHPKDQYPEFYFTPVALTEPPAEEDLIQNTLWSEVRKLYGHGYELFAVAGSHNGKLVASACKASTQQHAAIILWDTETWKELGRLAFHNLTITQMAFSPDDRYLLSVSRDRSWCMHEIDPTGPTFRKVAHADKNTAIHQRIIWSCSWSHDCNYFATASRDKKVVVWGKRPESHTLDDCLGPFESKAQLNVEDSATAVAFAPGLPADKRYLMAVGLENGTVLLYRWSEGHDWTLSSRLTSALAHHLTVRRLEFSPRTNGESTFQMASCGDDHFVRVYEISTTS
ncbi:probable elongator complex protein 2 isoform X2 [Ixodes scapularis]|uniref:probable elongator complex protein 2 isoform X2 n=1 Tax=Ixodes scapularis TaxID=6945 RepID=UPI001A9E826C|nr:probable elongator complex protein 2 isoform X2 [Ixodes scapularis]